jgi:Cytidylyltransferase family
MTQNTPAPPLPSAGATSDRHDTQPVAGSVSGASPTQAPVHPVPPFLSTELGRRIVSGVVMATVALGLTLAGGWWFAGLVTAGCLVMCWEWGRLVRGDNTASVFGDHTLWLHAVSVLLVIWLTMGGHPLRALGVILAAAAALYFLSSRHALTAFGAIYVGLPALVLVALRQEPANGLAAILYLFLAQSSRPPFRPARPGRGCSAAW